MMRNMKEEKYRSHLQMQLKQITFILILYR